MSKATQPIEIEDCFFALYEICINSHLASFPEPRPFMPDDWKSAGTRMLTRRLESIYPRPLKVGDKLLTLECKNEEYKTGPYKILIQEA